MEIDPLTTASRTVSRFLLISTIFARPILSKWVSFAIRSPWKKYFHHRDKSSIMVLGCGYAALCLCGDIYFL
jgi:hypothetical protein